MKTIHGALTILDVRPGEHIGIVYEQPDERLAVLILFIVAGLKRGEKVRLVTGEYQEALIEPLSEAGLDAEAALERRQLVTQPALPDWQAGADVAAWLHHETEMALAEGYTALRIALETFDLTGSRPLSPPLNAVELEAGLDTGLSNQLCAVLCLYRRSDLEAGDHFWNLLQMHSAVTAAGPSLAEIAAHRKAETALQEREAYHISFFENRFEPMLLIDPHTGMLVDANPAACDFYGYPREEFKNLAITDLNTLPPETILQEITHVRHGGNSRFNGRHRLADGRLREVEVHSGVIWRQGRELIYAIVHDVTPQRQIEQALRDSQERLSHLIETVPNGIIFTTPDGTIQLMNAAAGTILGIKAEAATDFTYEMLRARVTNLDGSPLPANGQIFHHVVNQNTPLYGFQCIVQREDRSQIYVSVNFAPFHGPHGEIEGVIASLTDITSQIQLLEQMNQERKRAETLAAGSRRQAEKWDAVFNALTDSVIIVDQHGNTLSFNPAAAHLYGGDLSTETMESALLKVRMYTLDGRPLDHWEDLPVFRALQGETVIGGQYCLINARGREMSILAAAAPIYQNGELTGAVIVINDITEREEFLQLAEEERRKAGEQAQWLAAVINAIVDIIIIVDAEGRIVRANPAAVRFYGIDPTQLERSALARRMQVRHLDGRPLRPEEFTTTRALQGEIVAKERYRFTTLDGKELILTISASPIRQGDQIIGAVAVWRDVTEHEQLVQELEIARRQAEQQAERLEREHQQARRLADKWNAVFNSITDAVLLYDATGQLVAANPETLRLYGLESLNRYNREKIIRDFQMRHADGRPLDNLEEAPSSRALQGETVTDERFIFTNAQGREIMVLISASPLWEEDQVIGAVAIWHDVTETERNQRLLQTLIDTIPAGVIAIDTAGNLLLRNPAAEKILDQPIYQRAQNYRNNCILYDLDGTPIPQKEGPLGRALLKGETAHHAELRLRRTNGSERIIEYSTNLVRNESRMIQGAIAVLQDITERKQIELETELERARWLTTLNTIPLPAIFIDSQKTVQIANPSAQELFQRQLIGAEWNQLFQEIHYLDAQTGLEIPPEKHPFAQALQGKTIDSTEIILVQNNGPRIPMLLYSSPVLMENEVVGAIIIAQDLTGLKEADRIKDQFLAMVSHDLRSPLATIKGWAGMAQDEPGNPKLTQKALDLILKGVQTQQRLIDDLLDSAALMAGIVQVRLEEQDLRPIIEQVSQGAQASLEKEIALSWELPAEPVIAAVDAVRLQQILGNLIANACKFTPKGGRIKIELQQEKDGAVIVVSDTGQGIPKEQLPHIFERFYSHIDQPRPGSRSLGLGLAIVKALVELHHGTVEALSAGKDQGSTFTLHLPRKL